MFDLIDNIETILPVYLLVFVRLTTMMIIMPIFSHALINNRFRSLIAFSFALIIGSSLSNSTDLNINSIWEFALLVVTESLLGFILGFGTKIVFEAFSVAGSMIGLQMGIAYANIIDPTTRQQVPIVSQFLMLLAILFLFATDGHLFLIETMVRHFEIIPLGLNQLSDQTGQAIIRGGSMMFLKGLQFAAPAMIMLLLIDTGIGFMARVMPQMNIFFVALPIKIGVGIIMLIFSVNIFQSMFDVIFNDLTIITNELISSFRI